MRAPPAPRKSQQSITIQGDLQAVCDALLHLFASTSKTMFVDTEQQMGIRYRPAPAGICYNGQNLMSFPQLGYRFTEVLLQSRRLQSREIPGLSEDVSVNTVNLSSEQIMIGYTSMMSNGQQHTDLYILQNSF